MFNRSPIGKYFVQVSAYFFNFEFRLLLLNEKVCGTTPCEIRGSNDIMAQCIETLGIKPGKTRADRKFTLLEVSLILFF